VGSNEAGSSSQVGESDETRGADTTPLNVPPAEPQSPIKDVAITIEEIPTEETIEEAPAEQLENNEDQEAESSGTEGGLTPDDATLLAAVKSFQAQNPSMGLAKVRQALKAYYGWELSKKRLKTCIPPTLPPDPLQVRLTYKDVVLYGYGKYNFGLTPITPNPDEGTVLDVSKTSFFFLIIDLLFFRSTYTQLTSSSSGKRYVLFRIRTNGLLLIHLKFSISGLTIKPAPRLLEFVLSMS
jgi:hypothetical protein